MNCKFVSLLTQGCIGFLHTKQNCKLSGVTIIRKDSNDVSWSFVYYSCWIISLLKSSTLFQKSVCWNKAIIRNKLHKECHNRHNVWRINLLKDMVRESRLTNLEILLLESITTFVYQTLTRPVIPAHWCLQQFSYSSWPVYTII